MRCEISRCLLAHLAGLAGAVPDQEICGLLLGEAGRIVAAVAMRNVAVDPTSRFAFAAADHVMTSRQARQSGLRIVGHYHSHPGGSAWPSRADADQAGAQGVYWLIFGSGRWRLWISRRGGPVHGAYQPVAIAPEHAPPCNRVAQGPIGRGRVPGQGPRPHEISRIRELALLPAVSRSA
ncbi:MAG TPA: M67 family metallopeptidase [Allosphingosinicella sp.]|nr:M67 family metallopeptidase [Allosphingosinicella sp.]